MTRASLQQGAPVPMRTDRYRAALEERRTPIRPEPLTPTEQAIREVCHVLSRAMWDADRRRTRR